MIEVCPQCHHRVLPSPDGTCPGCRRSVRDRTGIDASVTEVVIRSGEALPRCCLVCARETTHTRLKRLRRLTPHAAAARDDPLERSTDISIVLAFLHLLLIRLLRRGQDRVNLRIPLCKRCAADRKDVVVRHVRWDDHLVVLLCHRTFGERLKELRTEARAGGTAPRDRTTRWTRGPVGGSAP